jgi:predicted ATP-grasp superfamily ATP-dependent carboligase
MSGGAVVTGASYRALAVVRSLGRRGVPVRLVRSDEHALAAASRYARRRHAWPGGAAYLCDLARREGLGGWVLIPTHDEEAALIARHHAELGECFRLTTPAWETLRIAYDKRATHALAAELGLAQPWMLVPRGEQDLAAAERHLPVVIKPAYKASVNPLTVDKAWRADDPATLRRRYREACALVDPAILMVQALVPGGGDAQQSFAALCRDGEVLASLTARRTRQFPVEFGRFSTHVETTDDPIAARDGQRLVEAMRFTGLVEVEFKDGLLLDVNPRPWGWQSLGGRAGVDFPYLLWRMASGEDVRGARAVPGVRWVRMGTDVLAAGGELRSRRLSARSYLRSLRGPLEFAVFAPDDPLPALVGPLVTARMLARRLAEGRPV